MLHKERKESQSPQEWWDEAQKCWEEKQNWGSPGWNENSWVLDIMERRLSGEGALSVFLVLLFQGTAGRESSWGALEQWFSESCKLAHGILPVKLHDSPFTRSVKKWADGWSVPPCSFLICLWHLQFLVIKWSQKKKYRLMVVIFSWTNQSFLVLFESCCLEHLGNTAPWGRVESRLLRRFWQQI